MIQQRITNLYTLSFPLSSQQIPKETKLGQNITILTHIRNNIDVKNCCCFFKFWHLDHLVLQLFRYIQINMYSIHKCTMFYLYHELYVTLGFILSNVTLFFKCWQFKITFHCSSSSCDITIIFDFLNNKL